jgi:hypothetical protein
MSTKAEPDPPPEYLRTVRMCNTARPWLPSLLLNPLGGGLLAQILRTSGQKNLRDLGP